jgi:hypothetical protein
MMMLQGGVDEGRVVEIYYWLENRLTIGDQWNQILQEELSRHKEN